MTGRGPEHLNAVLATLPMFRELPPGLRTRVAAMATTICTIPHAAVNQRDTFR